jgi:hypothetical protein
MSKIVRPPKKIIFQTHYKPLSARGGVKMIARRTSQTIHGVTFDVFYFVTFKNLLEPLRTIKNH